jgi:protocatechuate 3,4-dioxygenase beta subunit
MEQITRRHALAAAGVAATTSAPAKERCALTPEQTEGPFYVPDSTVRRDISEGRPGVPLGVATFETIYPGWYPGRAVHIHVKVHAGGGEVHTGQLYFDDATSARVFASEPYRGDPDTTNASDGIYSRGGRESTIALKESGDGYAGALTMAVRA